MGNEKNVASGLSLFDTLLMGGIFMKNTIRRSLALIVALVVMVSVFTGISFESAKAAEGTTYTSLKNGDIIHVGDVLNLEEDIVFYNYGAVLTSKVTWTLARVDIVPSKKAGVEPKITESEKGMYYCFKSIDPEIYLVPIDDFGNLTGYEQVIFYATDFSDGLGFSKIDGKYMFYIHENVTLFNASVDENIKNGTVKVGSARPVAKSTVKITARPDSGYKLKDGSLKVKYGNKEIIPEKDPSDSTKFTFKMPEADVIITAEFEKTGDNTHKHVWVNGTITVKPTCTTSGIKTYTCKTDPSHTYEETLPPDKDAHDWGEWTVTKPATDKEEGQETRVCKNDASHIETRPIPIVGTEVEEKKDDYSVSFNSKFKVSQTKKKITVYWNKVNGAEYYEVYVCINGKKFSKVTAKADKTKKKISISKVDGKKLKLTKVYNVKVIAYDSEGKVIAESIEACVVGVKNTKYTNPKAVKTTKTKITLKVGKTSEIIANIVPYDAKKALLPESYGKQFRYVSSDEKVATVENGVITAVGKGSCTIYVYAINGYAAKITVKVK